MDKPYSEAFGTLASQTSNGRDEAPEEQQIDPGIEAVPLNQIRRRSGIPVPLPVFEKLLPHKDLRYSWGSQ